MRSIVILLLASSFHSLFGQVDSLDSKGVLFNGECSAGANISSLLEFMKHHDSILSDDCLFAIYDQIITRKFMSIVTSPDVSEQSIRSDTLLYAFIKELKKSKSDGAIELSNEICRMSSMMPFHDINEELCQDEQLFRASALRIQEAYYERLKFLRSRIEALKSTGKCKETTYLFYEVFSYRMVRLLESDYDKSNFYDAYTDCVMMLGHCFGFVPSVARDFGIKPSYDYLFIGDE